jgi:phosphoenolpyruvate-protein phosphotransferase (PTS system enzyme I)
MRPSATANPTTRLGLPPMQVLEGIAISPGIALGPVVVLDRRGLALPTRSIPAAAVAGELVRLERGLESARAAADVDATEVRERLGPQYAEILAAHGRMIADPVLAREARELVQRDRISSEHAVVEILEGYAGRLERLAGSHMAARAADVRDIEGRILAQLAGARPESFQDGLATPTIVLAHDLSPSEAAGLDPRRVPGFATEVGGRASHTAIVAAALEIPAVAGLGPMLERARHSSLAIVDGDQGLVILDPDEQTQERYRRLAAERAARFQVLAREADRPDETLDCCRVELWGNIEFGGEVAACLERGAAGVGLFRTEFLFLGALEPPGEDQQFEAYAAVVRALGGRPLTIRTLDLGADKVAGYRRDGGPEANPALGLRSLRLSLRDPALFRPQLRAIMRAAALGDVRILFPLVATVGEFRAARAVLDEVAAELRAEGHPIPERILVGVMVEVPAAALMADHLAKEVDFFSIGTNDLIQYTLAVDRTNETVAELYSAADPSVLRLIAMVLEAARKHGIPTTVCGAMGGEPLYAMLLLGLGIRQLSMPPHQLPEIKRVVRGIRLSDAEALAAEALGRDTAREVVDLLEAALRRALPEQASGPADASRSAAAAGLLGQAAAS